MQVRDWGFPGGAVVKNPPASERNAVLGLGRSPGGGHGKPLQYSCLGESHGQRSLVVYSPWDRRRVRHDSTHAYTQVGDWGSVE